MTLHRAELPQQSKTSVTESAQVSWMQGGGGGNQEITLDIPEAGT